MSRRKEIILWASFLGACLVLGGLKDAQNRRYRNAEAAHRRAVKSLQEEARREGKKFSAMLQEGLPGLRSDGTRKEGPGWTQDELMAHLPGFASLELVDDPKHPGRKKAKWEHPTLVIDGEFHFDDSGHFCGFGHHGAGTRMLPDSPSRATFTGAGEYFRGTLGRLGKVLWIASLLAWIVARQRRPATSQIMLAMAIVSTVADVISPRYTIVGVFSNDVVYYDAVMFAISCAALAVVSPWWHSIVSGSMLPRQFGIRWLMGVTALIAVLVTMRWYGYVIGSVLAIGAISYLILAAGSGNWAKRRGPVTNSEPGDSRYPGAL